MRRKKKPQVIHWVTICFVLPLGTLTLLFHNPTFVKWKPTAVDWLFASLILVSAKTGKKTMIDQMLGQVLKLPENIWKKLKLAWAIFFFVSGVANIAVAYACSERIWVFFKVVGLTVLMMVFLIGQIFFLQKYIIEDDLAKRAAENENAPPPP